MALPVRYRIIERNVQRLASPPGPMGRMLNSVTRTARDDARKIAPKRSSRLSRGIGINLAKRDGYLQLQGVLYANARHARWVHEGTKGPIKARGGKGLRVPRKRGSSVSGSSLPNKAVIYKTSVRGQKANPFLARAITSALVKERRVSVIGANRIQ